jgi:hypothetical protein
MSKTETAVATRPTEAGETAIQPFSAFGSIGQFTDAQRMAKALCTSSIVPETYRGEQRIGDCVIALEMANRIGANVLAVMQNLYLVHGKPAWSSQFLISCVNASRKFTPLRYKMTGQKGTDTYGCIAWAQDRTGETLESPEVTIAMAKAEGWFTKNGSKWKTMPELMLRYRAATLFARLYAPELTMGIQTDDEIIDIGPVVTEAKLATGARFTRARNVTPATQEAAPEPEPAPEPQAGPSDFPEPTELGKATLEFLATNKVEFGDFTGWLKSSGRYDEGDSVTDISEIPDNVLASFCEDTKGQNRLVTLYGKANQ